MFLFFGAVLTPTQIGLKSDVFTSSEFRMRTCSRHLSFFVGLLPCFLPSLLCLILCFKLWNNFLTEVLLS